MLKILITTNYKGSWPYVEAMAKKFCEKGLECDIYDTSEFKLINVNNNICKSRIDFLFLRNLVNIKHIAKYVRILVHFVFFKKNLKKYDIHTIHYIQQFYYYFPRTFRKFSKNIVLVAWGSDIFNISDKEYNKLSQIISESDYIVLTKAMFHKIENKISVKNSKLIYNLKVITNSIDELEKLMSNESEEKSRKSINIPLDAFVIVFGYNSIENQQHKFFLEYLAKNENELPENLLVIMPMTYPEVLGNYLNTIKGLASKLKVRVKIIDTFMSNMDTYRLRRISDFTINIQKTDGLASSIREHLFSNKPVLVGDWLPYDPFSDLGIVFFKTSLENYGNNIKEIINHYDFYKNKCKMNSNIIKQHFSFENNINDWINFYSKIVSENNI
jgi:glycosyltransferase involved in cell wall biosynthesis